MPCLAALRNEAGVIILGDEIVQVVVGLKNHIAAAPAVAAAGPALGDVSFAMERDTAFAAMARPRVNFDFVNKHEIWLRLGNNWKTGAGIAKSALPPANQVPEIKKARPRASP
jgi:hypothetical protein